MGELATLIIRDLLWSLRRSHRIATVRDLADAIGVDAACTAHIARTLCGWTSGLSPGAVEEALLDELGSSIRLSAV